MSPPVAQEVEICISKEQNSYGKGYKLWEFPKGQSTFCFIFICEEEPWSLTQQYLGWVVWQLDGKNQDEVIIGPEIPGGTRDIQ